VDEQLTRTHYRLRRKFFKLFGNDFYIYDEHDQMVLYSKMKGLKLKEDLRIYGSEDMNEELLVITTDQFLDIGAKYTVTDPQTDEVVGGIKRKAMKSMLKDEWVFLDSRDEEIGTLTEDSMILALVRRFLVNLIPQTYHAHVNQREVASYKQNWNPFIYKLDIDFSNDPDGSQLDRRLGLAAAVLLGGIEGNQN